MRKLLSLGIASALALGIAACGESEADKAREDFAAQMQEFTDEANEGIAELNEEIEADRQREANGNANWPALFCTLEPGQSREEAREVMGEPQRPLTEVGGEDGWVTASLTLVATYDHENKIIRLTGNDIPCASYRD